MPNSTLTQKELTLLSELMTYEHWAKQKSTMYATLSTEPDVKKLCETLEANHCKNFNDLFNHLNSK